MWMRSGLGWLAVALAMALLGTGHSPAWAQSAPKFWISNLEQTRFDARKFEGNIVVSFFFVDCVPCKKEIPQLHAMISEKYPDAALLFIDPIKEDSQADIEAFAARLNVPLTYFYADPLGRLAKKFFEGQFVFPTIVGMRDGKVLFRVQDLSEESVAAIEKALS